MFMGLHVPISPVGTVLPIVMACYILEPAIIFLICFELASAFYKQKHDLIWHHSNLIMNYIFAFHLDTSQ